MRVTKRQFGLTNCDMVLIVSRSGSFESHMFYAKHKFMKRSISAKQKKRGRPATGVRPMIGLRLSATDIARVDSWAAAHGLSRSEAIRLLIERGLKK